MRLRAVSDASSLRFLAVEYLCIAVVAGSAIGFCEYRQGSGLAWAWNIPVLATAVIFIGGLQHRLAGLGHEAAHYTLMRNKLLNDLIGDLLCLFPLAATLHFYRLFHLAHHQYTNDPERDPDIVSLGGSKMLARFPMSRPEFIRSIYLRAFTEPMAFLKYQWDYIEINVLGRSENIYLRRVTAVGGSGRAWPRLAAILGLAYLVAFVVAECAIVTATDRPAWLVVQGGAGTLLVLGVGALLPEWTFFPSPLRQPLSSRAAGLIRLCYYTWVFVVLGLLGTATGGRSTTYFLLLWVAPLGTTFTYFMLLRDVYQHTNADDGRLTNTRVFLPDPFTRWAVFIYGQDFHLPHHLYPGVPHHQLPELHRLLSRQHEEYATKVVECHGTFANTNGLPTILDALTQPRAANHHYHHQVTDVN